MDESIMLSRHTDSLGQTFMWAVFSSLVLFLIVQPAISFAQVVTNITPTTSAPLDLGTEVDTVGTTTEITGGTRPGSGANLFHSFNFFTLGTGDTAHFLNDMQLPTDNIFARVIGGEVKEASTIDGTLRTNNPFDPADPMNFGAAHLWLVNPSGVLLGPNARVDVGGSVSISTANYLRFFDGTTSTLFDMLSSPASLGPLLVEPVVAFGFLGSNPGAITVRGSQFSVTDGQSISLVGGKVSVESGAPEGGTAQPVQLSASNGKIQLASTASPGEFDAATLQSLPNVDGTSFTSFGSVSLAPGSNINVSGASTVFIKGGQIVLSVNDAVLTTSQTSGQPETISLSLGSSIVTSNSGAEPGADVQITVENLQMDGATVATINSGDGDGGSISINSTTIGLTNGASVTSSTGFDPTTFAIGGSGNGGNVTVQGLQGPGSAADSVMLSNGAAISTVTAFGLGRGGDVRITADTLLIENTSGVSTDTQLGAGVGGDLFLNVGTLTLKGGDFGGSTIRTSDGTGTDLDGDGVFDVVGVGGNVMIRGIDGEGSAADSVMLSGGSQIATASDGGDGGRVSIAATSLSLEGADLNGTPTTINSTAFGQGHGGDIVVSIQQASLSDAATIVSGTRVNVPDNHPDPTAGAGGTVTVQGLKGDGSKADSLILAGFGSGIISDAEGNGSPGDIEVRVKLVSLTDGAVIEGGNPAGAGTGGNVTIDADSVGIASGSHISSQARAQDAGHVTITADQLTLDNGAIVTTTASDIGGRGGDVVLNVETVSLSNQATINSSTSQTGRAGDITMNVGTLTLANNAEISSNSQVTASGDAGTLTIQGPGGSGTSATSVTLTNSSLLTNTEGTGAGGEIQIHADQVQLADLASLTAETSGTGKAGSIGVTSENLSVTGGARIEVSTAGVADAGDITITNTDTVSVTGLSSNGSTRSGIFAKTQTSGGAAGDGSGGGGGGSAGGGGGGGSGGGGGQTSTPGDAGNIVITTNNLLLSDGAQIDSSTTTSGSGGRVSVNADAITITGTSTSLKSDASRGNGTGGDIELVARTIGIHDKANVTAATDGSGNAGNISMTANESFTLDSAAIITTSTRGSGSGGTILINSPQVLVDGLGTSITASTLRPFADFAVTLSILHPNDGDLTVRLDSPDGTRVALLSRVGEDGDNFTGTIFDDLATQPITSGSAPFTGTFKPREPLAQLIDQTVAGTWKLNVTDQAEGNAEDPQSLQSWSLRVGDQVFQSTNIPRVIPDNGSVSSNLIVTGPAGAVVQGLGEASGIGGDVTINAGTVTVQNGATLSATTRGSGQGGTVNVNATGAVALAGPGAGLFTDSEASGRSGNINIAASSMTMDNGATVSAASSGTGDAGNITINSGVQFVSKNSVVITEATQASGGNITLTAQNMVQLINSQISTSVAGSATDTAGGNITIDPQFVILQNSQIIAQAFAGTGGNITIISNVFLADPISLVDASSQLGISGQINIQSPVQNVGEQLTPLSQQFSSAAALLAQQCAARAVDGKFSTFLVAAREGLPVEPGGFLASPSWTAELFGSSLSGRDPHTRSSAVTGAFPEHDAKPIQLAKFGGACRQ